MIPLLWARPQSYFAENGRFLPFFRLLVKEQPALLCFGKQIDRALKDKKIVRLPQPRLARGKAQKEGLFAQDAPARSRFAQGGERKDAFELFLVEKGGLFFRKQPLPFHADEFLFRARPEADVLQKGMISRAFLGGTPRLRAFLPGRRRGPLGAHRLLELLTGRRVLSSKG